MSDIKHFDNLAIVLDDFDIWGGRTALSESDFKLGEGGELPSSKIASLGNKKIISSDHLRGFNRLKTATRRFLLRHGMPFLNGVAIPVEKLNDITAMLDSIADEFKDLKNVFLQNYDKALGDWVTANPGYKEVILRNALTRDEVEKRLNFEYQVFMVQSSKDEIQNEKLTKKVELLGEELLEEIASTASKLYDVNFAGRVRCGVRAYNQIKALRDKIDGLAFLNGHLEPLVKMMDSAIALFERSSNGYVEAPDFWYVSSVVLILSQRRTIAQFANGEIQIQDTAFGLQEQERGLGSGTVALNNKAIINSNSVSPTHVNPTTQSSEASVTQAKEEENKNALSETIESDIDNFFNNFTVNHSAKPIANEETQAIVAADDQQQTGDTTEDKVLLEPENGSIPISAFSFDEEPSFF